MPSANAARLARFMLRSKFRAKREHRPLGTVHADMMDILPSNIHQTAGDVPH